MALSISDVNMSCFSPLPVSLYFLAIILIFFVICALAYIDISKNYLKISNVFKSNISGGDVIWLYYTTICFKCFLFGMINQIETMKTGNNELLSMYWHAGIDHCISAN